MQFQEAQQHFITKNEYKCRKFDIIMLEWDKREHMKSQPKQ